MPAPADDLFDSDEYLADLLVAGTRDHYLDAALYDHEYRRRRDDVAFYRRLAGERGGPILELGCGSGRLLAPLVRDGHDVAGVDLSAAMLRRCDERIASLTPEQRARACTQQGDFRSIDLGRRFALVVCAFNSFMHLYTRADVEQLLAVVKRHLLPGGVFAFDVMNPDLAWLVRDPHRRWARTRFAHPVTGAPLVYTTNHVWDGARQLLWMNIYYQAADGTEEVVRLVHRHFFPVELEALVHYNGLDLVAHLGDFDGEPISAGCDQQVLLCAISSTVKSTSPSGRSREIALTDGKFLQNSTPPSEKIHAASQNN